VSGLLEAVPIGCPRLALCWHTGFGRYSLLGSILFRLLTQPALDVSLQGSQSQGHLPQLGLGSLGFPNDRL